MLMKKRYHWLFILMFGLFAGFTQVEHNDFTSIRNGFINPPDSIRITAFYYWLNNHISKEGVIKDLHAMHCLFQDQCMEW